LNAALPDLMLRFSSTHAAGVNVSYGSSGTFFTQLVNGAPFDLFLSADIAYPRQLAARGLTAPGTEFTYAVGRIVVWVPASSTLDVDRLGVRTVADPSVRRVAIANPEHAPYGRAAVAAMEKAGVYGQAKSRLVLGESVAQAMQFVQSGAADVGIVALSLALAPNVRAGGRWFEIPAADYPRIEQGGVILKRASNMDAVQAFRAFLTGAEGREILSKYGFTPAGD
jgi:molybdate transport system substrate-binding protein